MCVCVCVCVCNVIVTGVYVYRFAYGSIGLPPSIPENSSITYRLELLDYAPEQSPDSMPLEERMQIG